MSQLERLATSLLKIAEQVHNAAHDLNRKIHGAKNSKEAHTAAGRQKLGKLEHNAHLLVNASIHLRHAAHELKQVKE